MLIFAIKGDTCLEDVASEGRVESSVLLGSLRGDHPRRLGLRDATLDGGDGERRARVRASRVKNDFMVSTPFHESFRLYSSYSCAL